MSKRKSAKHKLDRRMGENIWGRPSSPVNRRSYGPGQHGQRVQFLPLIRIGQADQRLQGGTDARDPLGNRGGSGGGRDHLAQPGEHLAQRADEREVRGRHGLGAGQAQAGVDARRDGQADEQPVDAARRRPVR